MKKWLRRLLIAALLVGLTFGVLYECATHVGRGWFCGEAFYEGRPTSYWRSRIDRWVARFESPEDAQKSMQRLHFHVWAAAVGDAAFFDGAGQAPRFVMVADGGNELVLTVRSQPDPTIWQRVKSILKREWADDGDPPKVLGAASDAEQVLRELEADEHYRPFTAQARRNVEFVKRHVTLQREGR